jgi:AcrR family transcriptional regulator
MPNDIRSQRSAETRRRILLATKTVLIARGSDLTLDEVAAELGLTKQAVLYHFPSKDRLLVELALQAVAAESEAMVSALAGSKGLDALRRFVRANLAFHRADLERFRVVYLRGQVMPGARAGLTAEERATRLYPVTARMYEVLEGCIRRDRRLRAGIDARRLAVAVHLATLGFVTMAGTLEVSSDAMKLPLDDYAEELIALVIRGARTVARPAARATVAGR